MKEIYRGERYRIEAEGATARKIPVGTSGPEASEAIEMKYCPERDVTGIAGCVDEADAWRLLLDVASAAKEHPEVPVCPAHVLIDGDGFLLSTWSRGLDPGYVAPEGYSASWAIGATLFYVLMGTPVFHGAGGAGQTATTPVPNPGSRMQALGETVARCLAFAPAGRPSVEELAETARRRLERLAGATAERKRRKEKEESADSLEDVWPEELK